MSGQKYLRPVAVTGIGLVGPTGNTGKLLWESLLNGRSGIGRILRFDASAYPCQIGGEVRDREYENALEPRKLRNTTHVSQLALAAADFALHDAQYRCAGDPDRTGVSIGTALGGWREAEQQHSVLLERGARRVNPFIANGSPNHAPGAEIASAISAQGPQMTFSNGCPSSLYAIAHGASLVASGELDMCIVGGAESPLIPMVMAGMGRTLELSTRNDEPEAASRPFDRDHNGMVLSEGACMFVLEGIDGAVARGAKIYGEIRSFAGSCDAQGMYNVDSSGEVAARSIHRALEKGCLKETDIDYVCAHANSSPAFDRKDTAVLKRAFGPSAARLPISSIKGVLGHPFGASGAFQLAATVMAMTHQIIPPTHNLNSPADGCDLDYVPREPRQCAIRNALITSHGYGGINGYLIVSQF